MFVHETQILNQLLRLQACFKDIKTCLGILYLVISCEKVFKLSSGTSLIKITSALIHYFHYSVFFFLPTFSSLLCHRDDLLVEEGFLLVIWCDVCQVSLVNINTGFLDGISPPVCVIKACSRIVLVSSFSIETQAGA